MKRAWSVNNREANMSGDGKASPRNFFARINFFQPSWRAVKSVSARIKRQQLPFLARAKIANRTVSEIRTPRFLPFISLRRLWTNSFGRQINVPFTHSALGGKRSIFLGLHFRYRFRFLLDRFLCLCKISFFRRSGHTNRSEHASKENDDFHRGPRFFLAEFHYNYDFLGGLLENTYHCLMYWQTSRTKSTNAYAASSRLKFDFFTFCVTHVRGLILYDLIGSRIWRFSLSPRFKISHGCDFSSSESFSRDPREPAWKVSPYTQKWLRPINFDLSIVHFRRDCPLVSPLKCPRLTRAAR